MSVEGIADTVCRGVVARQAISLLLTVAFDVQCASSFQQLSLDIGTASQAHLKKTLVPVIDGRYTPGGHRAR